MRVPCRILSVLVGFFCAQFPAQLFGAQSPKEQVASLLQLVSCVQTVASVGSSEYPLSNDTDSPLFAGGLEFVATVVDTTDAITSTQTYVNQAFTDYEHGGALAVINRYNPVTDAFEMIYGIRILDGPDQGKVMTTTERVESGFFFASNFLPAAGVVDDAARVGARTSAKTGSNTVRIVDAAPTRGPPSAPVTKTVGSETTEQAAKNADAGYPAGSKKIENINDLPKLEGYHYRQLANGEIFVARNPGRAGDLPKLKLENGQLVEAKGASCKNG